MKLSWLNTSWHTIKPKHIYDMNNMMQCKVNKRESKRQWTIANNKICFKVRVTTLRPRLHTEGFSLHTGPPTKGTSTEEFAIINLEYTTPLSNTTPSTLETRPKAKTQSPLHKRDGHKAKQQSPLHKRDKGTKPNSTTITSTQEGQATNPKHNHLYTRGIGTKPKQRKDYNLGDHKDHKQLLVITIDHK